MPEALSSFLISVSVIIGIALVVPCIESLVKLLRRGAQRQNSPDQSEPVKAYSREVA